MNPITYPKSIHQISLNKIDPKALEIIRTLQENGHCAYLVGGSIRDLLLGVDPKDFDISTSARPEEIKPLFSHCLLIGKRFRLAHVYFGRKIFEVATFRSGTIDENQLIKQDNVWGTAEEDILRRDFTMNALLYEPSTETVIDYIDGYADIKNQIIRAIGDPVKRFQQDPVRMLRCLKFTARFPLMIETKTLQGLISCSQLIAQSSPHRVIEEILRILESGYAKPFFQLLVQHQFIQALLPTLAPHLENSSHQIYNFLERMDQIKQGGQLLPRSLLIAALLFPLLEEHLESLIAKGKAVYIQTVHQEGNLLLGAAFYPFLRLPKKLKISALTILTTQFRFTPLYGKKRRKLQNFFKDLPLAIHLLSLRVCFHKDLRPIYEEIKEEFEDARPIYQSHYSKKKTS